MSEQILETENLTKEFSGLFAIDDVSIGFKEGVLHSIIGPNGAGKTTFFNLLTGALRPSAGRIIYKGEDITDLSPEKVAQRHMIRSYQVTNVFGGLSVRENVRVAAQSQHSFYNFWRDADDYTGILDQTHGILERVGLEHKADASAANLSHGEQRTLELAIALGADPDMLLLDEPSSGMSSEETNEIIDLIKEIATDTTILLVEHKMSVVREVSDRVTVLHDGQILATGTPEELQENEQVRQVYLQGGTYDSA